jgi:hypothetical protein
MSWYETLCKILCGKQIDELNLQINDLSIQLVNAQANIAALKTENTQLKAGKTKTPIPKITGTISYNEVFTILNNAGAKDIRISDMNFSTCSMEEAQVFVAKAQIQYEKYVAETHDCDNFSAELWGYWNDSLQSFPFGIVWSKTHAFNFFIDDKKKLWIVEPQQGRFYSIEDLKNNVNYSPWELALV